MKEETEKMLVDAIINLGVNIENLRKEMKTQLAKVNAGISEMRTSYMKLDERVETLNESFNRYAASNEARLNGHETRITRLENHSSVVSEPRAVYKKTKKKK